MNIYTTRLFGKCERSTLQIGGCFGAKGSSKRDTNAIVCAGDIHVIVKSELKVYVNSYSNCDEVLARDLSHPHVSDTRDACYCLAGGWADLCEQICYALAAELELEANGPRSVVLNEPQTLMETDPNGPYETILLSNALRECSVVIHFTGCEDLLMPAAYPQARYLMESPSATLKPNRRLKALLRGFVCQCYRQQEMIDGVSFVVDCFSLNMRRLWGMPIAFKSPDISRCSSEFSFVDLISNLRRWGTFCDPWDGIMMGELMRFCGPPAVYDKLVKYVDLLHIDSFAELHSKLSKVRKLVECALITANSGFKYMTKSMAVFCLTLRNCAFGRDEWFQECLMRLVKGGVLNFGFESVGDCHYVLPFYPLLLERMASRLGTLIGLLDSLVLESREITASNSRSVREELLVLQILSVSSNGFWDRLENHDLRSLFDSKAIVSYIGPISHVTHWTASMRENVLYIIHASADCPSRRFAFVARYRGLLAPVVVEVTQFEDYRAGQLSQISISAQCTEDPPLVKISVALPADTLISPLVKDGIDLIPLDETIRKSFFTSSVFYDVFKRLRVKLPWWDTSKRFRTHDIYMARKLGVEYTKARTMTRLHRATALTYTDPTPQTALALGVPLKNFELYRKQSELYRVKAGIPHILSVVSVRLLVRHLLEWGAQLTEVIEVRRILKRSRVYLLTLTSLPTEILKSSKLALGTRMALMAIADAVNNRTVAY